MIDARRDGWKEGQMFADPRSSEPEVLEPEPIFGQA